AQRLAHRAGDVLEHRPGELLLHPGHPGSVGRTRNAGQPHGGPPGSGAPRGGSPPGASLRSLWLRPRSASDTGCSPTSRETRPGGAIRGYTSGAGASQDPKLRDFDLDLIESAPYDSVLTAREARAHLQVPK